MPCKISKVEGGKRFEFALIDNDSWDLRNSLEEFESWIRENDGKLNDKTPWIADIGFSTRQDASGGGPTISVELMRICVRNNVTIHLSEFGE